ncbi:uncharacterized protein LOC101857566 [Aplysia californica]|uniref:Uncharacterized protein LOC101857566 n=1 Tax=Aplysia californica TaxID=6500 RepID=A0ABM0JNG5_APLCA|nr:uncharacterized protein LOC101857566 [Aplysia californica]
MKSSATSMVVVVLFLLLHVSPSLQHVESSVSDQELQELLTATDTHYMNLKRSLGKLDQTLQIVPLEQSARLTNDRLIRRSDMSRLLNSLTAFCETLQNENETGSTHEPMTGTQYLTTVSPPESSSESVDSAASVSGEKPEGEHTTSWWTPDVPVLPLSVRSKYRDGRVTLTFRVLHSVPAYAMQDIDRFGHGPSSIKRLSFRRNEPVPKISKSRFTVSTRRCLENGASAFRHAISFQFGEAGGNIYTPRTSVRVNVCSGGPNNNATFLDFTGLPKSREENIDLPRFDLNLSSSTILIREGQNKTFQVRVSQLDNFSFFAETLAYDTETSNISKSLWWSTNYMVVDDIYRVFVQKADEYGSSDMTRVELAPATEEDTSPETLDHGPGENGRNSTAKTATLQISLDTDSGLETGVIALSQSRRVKLEVPDSPEPDVVVLSTSLTIPVQMRRPDLAPPIPEGNVVFMGRTESLCNTNRRSKHFTSEPCAVECRVKGMGIAALTIRRSTGSSAQEPEILSQVSPGGDQARAYAVFEEADPRASGEYVCEASLTNGKTERAVLNLRVGSYPDIPENGATIEDAGNRTALITCTATGDDVDLAIFANEKGQVTRLDGNSTNSDLEVEVSSGSVTYKLYLPFDRLEFSVFQVACRASNALGEDVEYIYVSNWFNDYYRQFNPTTQFNTTTTDSYWS